MNVSTRKNKKLNTKNTGTQEPHEKVNTIMNYLYYSIIINNKFRNVSWMHNITTDKQKKREEMQDKYTNRKLYHFCFE